MEVWQFFCEIDVVQYDKKLWIMDILLFASNDIMAPIWHVGLVSGDLLNLG